MSLMRRNLPQKNSTQWKVRYSNRARKELSKLDKPIRDRVREFVRRLSLLPDPRLIGKALSGTLNDYWSYRTGDYRIICYIHDKILEIEIVGIGHRSEIYKKDFEI